MLNPARAVADHGLLLVTGGAGFIGSHTVRLLLRQGHRVRVLDNLSSGRFANLTPHPQLQFVHADIRDREAVRAAMEGVQRVLHLAAQVSVVRSLHDPGESAAINLGGFLNVLEASRQLSVQRLVYASSAAVYGVTDDVPLMESCPLMPISPYGLEKRVNEDYAALYQHLHGTNALGLRYFNVYGPGQEAASPYSGVLAQFVDQCRNERPLTVHGDGRQSRDFIHVADVAAANAHALASAVTGVMNVGSGHAHSLNEIVQMLTELRGRVPQILYAPARQGDIRYSCADNALLRVHFGAMDGCPLREGLRGLLLAAQPAGCIRH